MLSTIYSYFIDQKFDFNHLYLKILLCSVSVCTYVYTITLIVNVDVHFPRDGFSIVRECSSLNYFKGLCDVEVLRQVTTFFIVFPTLCVGKASTLFDVKM